MPDTVSLKQIRALPPSIFGTIRWKTSVGQPTGDWRSGFRILCEEHTPTTFVDVGGGHYVPRPGVWKVITDSPPCRVLTTEGGYHAISFNLTGLHLSAFPDGCYRISPSLKGAWKPPGVLPALFTRAIQPISATFVLQKDNQIQSVEFEVVRRSWFFVGRSG
ncbi:hypothetical protein KXS15_26650 [Sinorhizobium meliloti]|uniref:hypothetical protein n=1 Tax=Rhizobium meliloti TaxID=382 RepID=UPI003F14AE21